jgi:hypothetical protein
MASDTEAGSEGGKEEEVSGSAGGKGEEVSGSVGGEGEQVSRSEKMEDVDEDMEEAGAPPSPTPVRFVWFYPQCHHQPPQHHHRHPHPEA